MTVAHGGTWGALAETRVVLLIVLPLALVWARGRCRRDEPADEEE